MRCTSSSGTGAPATTPGAQRPGPARSRRPGALSARMKLVGTPWNTVTRSRSTMSSTVAGVVPLVQHQRRARHHRPQHPRADAERVEQRVHAEHHVVGAQPQRVGAEGGVGHQVLVRELHPLGLAHGARGVEDGEQLVRAPLVPRVGATLAAAHQVLELVDAVVVPEVFLAHGQHVLQVRQHAQELLEAGQVVRALPVLRRDHGHGLGVPQHVLQLRAG